MPSAKAAVYAACLGMERAGITMVQASNNTEKDVGCAATVLTPELMRRAKLYGDMEAFVPLMRAIHDLLLLQLSGWPRPATARRSLNEVWSRCQHYQSGNIPEGALAFVRQQLCAMRCPMAKHLPKSHRRVAHDGVEGDGDRVHEDGGSESRQNCDSRMLLLTLAWLFAETNFFERVAILTDGDASFERRCNLDEDERYFANSDPAYGDDAAAEINQHVSCPRP